MLAINQKAVTVLIMNKIEIVGYEKEEVCAHCGRKLKHGIRLSDGRVVGAQCFNKDMTKPREYSGKKYRVGAENIIKLAKIREFWSAEKAYRAGYQPSEFVFQSA